MDMHGLSKGKFTASRRDFLRIMGTALSAAAFSSFVRFEAVADMPESSCSGSSQCTNYLEEQDFPVKENPLVIDEKGKRVLIYTEVCEKNVHQYNAHWGVVFRGGELQDRAILMSYVNPLDFHDALIKIGARPGDNLKKYTNGHYVKGDTLDVKATWPGLGKVLSLDEIFIDKKGRGFQIKFGGNRRASEEQKTGCLTCLESCWISITSNANYPQIGQIKRWISPNSRFKGRADVLPEDGKPVILIYRVEGAK